jgi:hypothetical protein
VLYVVLIFPMLSTFLASLITTDLIAMTITDEDYTHAGIVRFDIPMVSIIKSSIFMNVMPYNLADLY